MASIYGIRTGNDLADILAKGEKFAALRRKEEKSYRDACLRLKRRQLRAVKPQPSLAQRLLEFKRQKLIRLKREGRREELRRRRHVKKGAWPVETMRGSRIDWYAICAVKVAESQIRHEIDSTVVKMREAGITFKAIAEKFGVSSQAVINRFNRHRRPNRPIKAPVQVWMESAELLSGERGAKLHRQLSCLFPATSRDWLYV